MKKFLLTTLLIIVFTAFTKINFAQSNRAYAITGETQGNVNWTVVRQVDLSTGALIRNIYIPSTDKPLLLDALTGRQIAQDKTVQINSFPNPATMVAAAALDAKNNHLYFTTMQGLQLRYIDLNSQQLKIYYVQNPMLKQFASKPGEDDNITRMSFASDGFGYALTNNGNHFIRFSTDKNVKITDLGSLKDGINNENFSVHNMASWGGDMVGDAFNNLFLFTVKGNVYKINVQTLVADYLGTIKNLPEGFTINAAAVDGDASVVVSSAINASNYYRVNLANLEAAPVSKKASNVFNASDFANESFAYQNEANKKLVIVNSNKAVTTFPNPVTNKNFTIIFDGSINGNQTVQIITLSGKILLNKVVDASAKTAKILLPQNAVPGTYVLKVNSEAGKQIYSDKIIIQ
ncbi:MAG: T9SS type A sorting domain-containing protein [Chitinophagaceae bacterium]